MCETDSSIDGVVIVIERTRPRLVAYHAVDFVNHVPLGVRVAYDSILPLWLCLSHMILALNFMRERVESGFRGGRTRHGHASRA